MVQKTTETEVITIYQSHPTATKYTFALGCWQFIAFASSHTHTHTHTHTRLLLYLSNSNLSSLILSALSSLKSKSQH